MFAYCGNNPINRIDPEGSWWLIIPAIIIPLFLSGCDQQDGNEQVGTPPYSGCANCYAYALQLENDPRTNRPFSEKPQPGSFGGEENTEISRGLIKSLHNSGGRELVEETIEKKVKDDVKALGLTFTPVGSADHVPIPGNWIVALAYSTSTYDYHWWRKGEDGNWSHKPGEAHIMYRDFASAIITDPATSHRGPYDVFIGYYEVGPNTGG